MDGECQSSELCRNFPKLAKFAKLVIKVFGECRGSVGNIPLRVCSQDLVFKEFVKNSS